MARTVRFLLMLLTIFVAVMCLFLLVVPFLGFGWHVLHRDYISDADWKIPISKERLQLTTHTTFHAVSWRALLPRKDGQHGDLSQPLPGRMGSALHVLLSASRNTGSRRFRSLQLVQGGPLPIRRAIIARPEFFLRSRQPLLWQQAVPRNAIAFPVEPTIPTPQNPIEPRKAEQDRNRPLPQTDRHPLHIPTRHPLSTLGYRRANSTKIPVKFPLLLQIASL